MSWTAAARKKLHQANNNTPFLMERGVVVSPLAEGFVGSGEKSHAKPQRKMWGLYGFLA